MMNKLYLIAILALTTTTAQGASITYNFSQGGYEEGASVAGSFTAEDIDLNSQVDGFAGEVSDFSMTFSGNSLVPAFELIFVDLFSLVYDLDGTIGDGILEGIAASDFVFSYDVGASPFAPGPPFVGGVKNEFTFQTSVSSEHVLVTRKQVPDPGSTIALFGLGLLAVVTTRKRFS